MMILMSETENLLAEDYSAILVNCVQTYLLTAIHDTKKSVLEILTMVELII